VHPRCPARESCRSAAKRPGGTFHRRARDTAYPLATLTAGVTALEAAVHTFAGGSQLDRGKPLAAFDAFGREMLDRYSEKPVDDRVLELMEESFNDVRRLLTGD
jgi:hypothetical protein